MSCPDGEYWKETEDYCWRDFPEVETEPVEKGDPETVLDSDSIRSKKFEDDEGDTHIVQVGCPVGHWDDENERCDVGTRATRLGHKKSDETTRDMKL